jgi:small-conductance mechanosensitive channel
MVRPFMLRLVLITLLCVVASPAEAQEQGAVAAPAEARDESAEDWIRPTAIPARADALATDLEGVRPDDTRRQVASEIGDRLEDRVPRLEAISKRIDSALRSNRPINELDDLRRELDSAAAPLVEWQETLDAEGLRTAAQLDSLERSKAVWKKTTRRPETREAGAVLVQRARDSLQQIEAARELLLAWRGEVIALEARVADHNTRVKGVIDQLGASQRAQRTSLLIPAREPIWQTEFTERLRDQLPLIPQAARDVIERSGRYIAREPRLFVAHALFILLLTLALRHVGERVRRRQGAAAELDSSAGVLLRPISISLLLALLATPWFHPLAPPRFRHLAAVIALVPVARIVRVASPGTSRGVLAGLFALLLLDRIGMALSALPAVSQALFAVSLVFAIGIALRVMRRGGLPGDPALVRRIAGVAAVASAAALLAEVGGWVTLAGVLGRGTLMGALLGIYLWAAVAALDALASFSLQSPRFTRFGLGPDGGQSAARRTGLFVRGIAVLFWAYAVLRAIGLGEPALDGLQALLAAGISIGALSLTVGGVLAFSLTVVAAPILARIIDLVLQHGVFPYTQLPRGVPYALSTLVRYGVYVAGFLAALAAAGVQLSQLSIVLGGLGVGVGLGLQDVVKNFAAGLTVLLERRIHVNDVVQILGSQINGRVLEIGIRATLVRTWDGAEVVLPNTDLTASAVTNWTLSDHLRRIEIPVGVEYGTDPARVVSLLIEAVQSHRDIVRDPPPQALFQGFGDSSLDFLVRAWTDAVYDNTFAIRSELVLAVHASLEEAGITIPFPQRDLHLASVAPAAREVLARDEPGVGQRQKPGD